MTTEHKPHYVRTYESGLEYAEHIDGIDWYEAPAPPRKHKHWAQTRGFVYGDYAERCPCGAFGPEPWLLLPPDRPRVIEDPVIAKITRLTKLREKLGV